MDTLILIVDDSAVVVETLAHILSGQGYRVESRGDGATGWERLVIGAEGRAPMPDLLLLDIHMPEVDGLELLRRIRADERFALLPVMILTVEADADTRLLALESGANDYLPKPVQTVELLARVRTLMNWKLAERLQQRRMEHLVEAGRVLLSTRDLDAVLRRVMQIAVAELNTEGASIWLKDADEGLECQAAFGNGTDRLIGIRLEPGQGIAGWVVQHQQSVLVSDAQADPRLYHRVDEQIDFHTRSLVAVPLLVRGSCIGVLEAANKKQESFSPADLSWMEVLAPLAASAIANAQLFHALQRHTAQLEARNKDLDAFAHTVAHDLKSPVARIVGFAEALELTHAELPDEKLRHYLRLVAQSGRKMDDIIHALLLLGRVRRIEVEMAPLDMASIVSEAIERQASLIEERQAEIIVPETWPVALGYGPWVEEVWANYLSNALKYGGQPPRVELGATPPYIAPSGEPSTSGHIRFWVRDNGPGIPPASQTRLFAPFSRLDQGDVEGHGLGLSIVQRIVDKLGGEVGVESNGKHGSVFSFTLASAPSEISDHQVRSLPVRELYSPQHLPTARVSGASGYRHIPRAHSGEHS